MNVQKKKVLPQTLKLWCRMVLYCDGMRTVFCLCNTEVCSYHPSWLGADRNRNLCDNKKIGRRIV